MKNIEKSIKLICHTCGNDQFLAIDDQIEDLMSASDETQIKCSDCGVVVTKEQLIENNQLIIDANMQDIQNDFVKELEKKLSKLFK